MTIPQLHVSYDELPTIGPENERHAWDYFGSNDQLGCVNFITSESVRRASSLVQQGLVFNLDLPVDQPQPQFWAGSRAVPSHHEIVRRQGRDDYLETLYLQGSTQWDGLRHYRYREFGYFGGRQDSALDDLGELGIDAWAEHGIVTRGVLVDVPAFLKTRGEDLPPDRRYPISGALIEEVLKHFDVKVEAGTVLLLRTGWLEWYQTLPMTTRHSMQESFEADRATFALPGLDPKQETMAWLWNHRVAGVAADNATLETLPYLPDEGWAHRRMIPLLGMPIGELWNLSELARACRQFDRYEFLLTSSPMNVPKGVGSPANAYAVM